MTALSDRVVWRRMRRMVYGGTTVVLLALVGGTGAYIQINGRSARLAAGATLQRAAQSMENTLNRHLLQVDGALASLPGIFAAVQPTQGSITATAANQLLRELNFQTAAFRDLILVARDGKIWAAARSHPSARGPIADIAATRPGAAVVLGPLRNRITGDWSVYLARAIELSGIGSVVAVAEIPVPVLVKLLSENAVEPGTRVEVARGNGHLLASSSPDRIGRTLSFAPGDAAPVAKAFESTDATRGSVLVVARPSLYGDLFVVLETDTASALSGWARDRGWIYASVGTAGLLIIAFASALVLALRQRERRVEERTRAGVVLEDAIETMSDGFVMWDADDRLVTCNQRYRDLYAVSEPFLHPGASFEDIVRRGAEAGQYPEAEGRIDAFVDGIVAWRKSDRGAQERLLPDGRWLMITERRMRGGGVVGIRTDISAFKAALTDLADANDRAMRAADEIRQQNETLLERDRALEFLAHHDDLTGLPNRALFRHHLHERLRSAQAGRAGPVALLYLDLDRFKDVNDTLGHPAGDALLKEVADRLRAVAGQHHAVFRLGGDEFALICAAPDLPEAAERLSDRLILALQRSYTLGAAQVTVGASVGIAIAADQDADTLLKQADVALYRAKAEGRGARRLFIPEMEARLQARMEMERDLRLALARDEFELAYQPIRDLATDRTCGFEALLRWRHPTRGPVSPAVFIPLAEEIGLIFEIGAWVLNRACADIAPLPSDLTVAVNLSPVQLGADDIVGMVSRALQASGLHPNRLELEITETALVGNTERTTAKLLELRAIGIGIALDDFGTGYSSLSHLRKFPLSKIKIDQSFVFEMPTRADCEAIVTFVTQLAERLEMTTTAEGVETAEQLALVRAAGCTQAQGYLIGRPEPLLAAVGALGAARRMPPRLAPGERRPLAASRA